MIGTVKIYTAASSVKMFGISHRSLGRFFHKAGLTVLSGTGLAWIIYAAVGHRLIEILYNSTSLPIVDRVLSGRSATPLAEYYKAANTLMLDLTGRVLFILIIVALAVFAITKPRWFVLSSLSILAFSFLLFCLLEAYPPLIHTLQLHRTSYYKVSLYKVPDPEFGFRGRPLLHFRDRRVEDNFYALHRLEAPTGVIEWTSNRDGFRGGATDGFSDIVVIGDSFIDHGWNDNDTFGKRLQRHIDGWKVTNLAVAGWSPHQYLQALNRYAIQMRPRYVLFSFYAGNDYWQIRDYLHWKSKGTPLYAYAAGSKSFLQRYALAMAGIVEYIRTAMRVKGLLLVYSLTPGSGPIEPDIAILALREGPRKVLFVDKHMPMTTKQLLITEEWQELKRILAQFKKISLSNGIQPCILYIPMGISIYAEYSTGESGTGWLKIRDSQIAHKDHIENAIKDLARETQIELLNLTVPFSRAAKNGQILYEPVDDHWNSEGREVAARYVAERLATSRGISAPFEPARTRIPRSDREVAVGLPGSNDLTTLR